MVQKCSLVLATFLKILLRQAQMLRVSMSLAEERLRAFMSPCGLEKVLQAMPILLAKWFMCWMNSSRYSVVDSLLKSILYIPTADFVCFLLSCAKQPRYSAKVKAASLPDGSIAPQSKSQIEIQRYATSPAVVPMQLQAFCVTLTSVAMASPNFPTSSIATIAVIILVKLAISRLYSSRKPKYFLFCWSNKHQLLVVTCSWLTLTLVTIYDPFFRSYRFSPLGISFLELLKLQRVLFMATAEYRSEASKGRMLCSVLIDLACGFLREKVFRDSLISVLRRVLLFCRLDGTLMVFLKQGPEAFMMEQQLYEHQVTCYLPISVVKNNGAQQQDSRVRSAKLMKR